MTDAKIKMAIRLRNDLVELAPTMPATFEKNTCVRSAEMLQTLGTEVTRLREAIGCFLYGRLDRNDLRKISETWNGDAK